VQKCHRAWSEGEDRLLERLVIREGAKVKHVRSSFPGRTNSSIWNRVSRLRLGQIERKTLPDVHRYSSVEMHLARLIRTDGPAPFDALSSDEWQAVKSSSLFTRTNGRVYLTTAGEMALEVSRGRA
jgi:hypothetical protein